MHGAAFSLDVWTLTSYLREPFDLALPDHTTNATAFSRAKASVSNFATFVASAFAVPAFAAARV